MPTVILGFQEMTSSIIFLVRPILTLLQVKSRYEPNQSAPDVLEPQISVLLHEIWWPKLAFLPLNNPEPKAPPGSVGMNAMNATLKQFKLSNIIQENKNYPLVKGSTVKIVRQITHTYIFIYIYICQALRYMHTEEDMDISSFITKYKIRGIYFLHQIWI